VMGILLFQDLAVVPLLILIPALGSASEQLLPALGWALIKAVVLVGLLLTGGQRFMRWWLTLVARRKSEELFMLNLLLITLGLAWLTELAGLSLALGAFIAGVLVSETEYRHQVGTDIRPFHDVLLGLFFITVGMMLDWHILIEHWALVLALLVLPMLLKAGIILALARGTGATTGTSLRTGLYLAQAGEFGFVLLTLTQTHGLVQPALLNPILAAMVLSMLATPFLIGYSNAIVMKLVASDWLQQSLQMTTIARKSINTSKHVIICGYGRCGQNLARMLEREGIPYMALDLDPDRVRQARAAGHSVVFGDATKPAGAGGRRPGARQCRGHHHAGPARRDAGAGQHPRPGSAAAGDRAHADRPRSRQAARRRRHRGGARIARGLADAGRPRAGAGGRAHAARAAHGAGPARCPLQHAARVLPWGG